MSLPAYEARQPSLGLASKDEVKKAKERTHALEATIEQAEDRIHGLEHQAHGFERTLQGAHDEHYETEAKVTELDKLEADSEADSGTKGIKKSTDVPKQT